MCKTEDSGGTPAEVGHGVLWKLLVLHESPGHPSTRLNAALGAHRGVGCVGAVLC